jgi:hypothetical protein
LISLPVIKQQSLSIIIIAYLPTIPAAARRKAMLSRLAARRSTIDDAPA